jgi:uncharacterized protein
VRISDFHVRKKTSKEPCLEREHRRTRSFESSVLNGVLGNEAHTVHGYTASVIRKLDVKILLALPGIVLGLIGVIGCGLMHREFSVPPPEILTVTTLGAYFAILALAHGLERALPSFRDAGGLLENVLARLRLTPSWAFALAATSSIGEELFFRWFLLGLFAGLLPVWVAVVLQAMIFAAFHPAPRRAWGYPLWTFLAGIVFGMVTVGTGSVLPSMLAHYVFNHDNMNEALEPAQSRV